jgi:hypothetical protein
LSASYISLSFFKERTEAYSAEQPTHEKNSEKRREREGMVGRFVSDVIIPSRQKKADSTVGSSYGINPTTQPEAI